MTSSFVCSSAGMGGQVVLGVVAARAYRGLSRRLEADPHALAAVHHQPVRRGSSADSAAELIYPSDRGALHRPLTDVLLLGTAYSHRGPVTVLDTAVQVGRVDKRVRVIGERQVRIRQGGTLAESAPQSFHQMPLSYARAYGGRDRDAEKLLVPDRAAIARSRTLDLQAVSSLGAYSYPRNAIGRGFWIDVERSRLEGEPLPNLLDPVDPVTPDRLLARDPSDWTERPIAAGYGPIDALTFPRSVFFGLRAMSSAPRAPLRELALGGVLPGDLLHEEVATIIDPRAYNCAPAGLAVCRLQGGERVSLYNLHPRHELLEFDLPAERPRLLIEPPNTKIYELEPKLQTVLFEPDQDRVTLTWTGAMPVGAVYPEDLCAQMKHRAVWYR